MSVSDIVSRVQALETLIQRSLTPAAPQAVSAAASPSLGPAPTFADVLAAAGGLASPASPPGGTADLLAGELAGFPAQLQLAGAPALAPAALPATGGPAPAIVQAAESQVGQAEQPPGSNDGPAVAAYRSAVAGAVPGAPWCAYFASWAARAAGTPIGDGGAGIGSVAGITDWAARTGRLLAPGTPPAPGDLILFGDRHVGIVESVAPDGTLTTIEGNEANAVTRRTRMPSEPTGFVRL